MATSSIGGASYGGDSLHGGSRHGSRHGSPVSTPRLGNDAGTTGNLHVQSFMVSKGDRNLTKCYFPPLHRLPSLWLSSCNLQPAFKAKQRTDMASLLQTAAERFCMPSDCHQQGRKSAAGL